MSLEKLDAVGFLLSEAVDRDSLAWVRDYAILCARNADPDSRFEVLLRPHIQLPDGALLKLLLYTGYDGFVMAKGNKVVGHVWFQKRQDELGVFSVWIAEEYRVELREEAVLGVILRARAMPGIRKVRFGTDIHARAVSWIIEWLQRKHGDIGIVGHQGGQVLLAES